MSTDLKITKKTLIPLQQKGRPSIQDVLKSHARQVNLLLETEGPISFDQTIGLLEKALGQIKKCEGNRPVDGPRSLRDESRLDREFLFTTFHEMRNPLQAIMGYAGLVLRKTRDQIPEKHQENLEKIIQSADRLKELVDRMVAYYWEK